MRKTYNAAFKAKVAFERVSFGFRNVDIYIRKMLLCILFQMVVLPWLPH